MAGQGRTLFVLGGLLAAGIAAAVWFVLSDPGAETAQAEQDAAKPQSAEPKAAAPAAARTKRVGNAVVFGEIRRTAGKAAVVGQVVRLAGERGERGEPWTATTDDTGAFRFEKIPHGGPYELSAAAAGCAPIRLPGLELERDERRDLGTLFLDPAVKALVRVRDLADAPVAGALVEAFAVPAPKDGDYAYWTRSVAQMTQAPVAVANATTDAAGEALFPETAVGQWTFAARKEGYAPSAERRVRLRADVEPAPIVVRLAPGHALEGRVLDSSRKPVADAMVIASPPNTMYDVAAAPMRARANVDAEGRYAFAALESGEQQLFVARAGGLPTQVGVLRVPSVGRFDIVLAAEGTLTGVVTDREDGKPIDGVLVRAQRWEEGMARVAEATTDAEGRYSLRFAVGIVNRVDVEKRGYVQVRDETSGRSNQSAAVVREGETSTLDLVARRGARVIGIVRAADGPVAGARVIAYFGRPNEGFQQRAATSDAEGRYEIVGLDKGQALVTASKEGFWQADIPDNTWQALQNADTAKQHKVEVPETGDATKDVEMKRGSTVAGVVLGPDGQPLAGVRVSGIAALEAPPTDAAGAFRLVGVKPGPGVRLMASKEGYSVASVKAFALTADQPLEGVTLRMNREARLRGTVTTASGAAPKEARILIASRSGATQNDPWSEMNRWQNAVRIPVAADGTFDGPVRFGAPGQLLVRAVSLDHAQSEAQPIELVEGQESYETRLVLVEGTDLVGTVVAKNGGAPVAGARVSVAPAKSKDDPSRYYGRQGPPTVWAVTDEVGAFRVGHAAPGAYEVRAWADGFVATTRDGAAGSGTPLVVELPPELTIEGVVCFADGTTVPGVAVSIPLENARPGDQQPSGVTDAKGAFRIAGVPEGRHALDVRPNWDSDANMKPTRLPDVVAGTKDVRVVVEAGGTISGRVVDSKGRGVAQAWIHANPAPKQGVSMRGNEWRNARTKQDGSFVLGGLAEGPYDLQVSNNSYGGPSSRPARLPGVAVGTRDVVITLEDGQSITGVLVDEGGRPVANVALQATPLDSQGGKVQGSQGHTQSDGSFTIGGLAAGNYVVAVPPWGGGNQAWVLEGAATFAAGTTDVRLVAVKGVTISGVVQDESGKGLGGASIQSFAEGGSHRWTNAAGDGTFELVGLVAGRAYRLDAAATGYVGGRLEDVQSGTKGVRFVLLKGLDASGLLLDAEGKPLPSTHLSFTSTVDKRLSQHAQTDASGRFKVQGLADGPYQARVYVQKPEGGDWKEVGSLKGGDRDVELRMP